MRREEYLKFVRETLDEVFETIQKKNHDYTGGTDDAFSNFRLAELDGVDPIAGIMLRMSDKQQRIRTYLSRGELMVDGEGFEDAWKDIIGYALLGLGMCKERADLEGMGIYKDKWIL